MAEGDALMGDTPATRLRGGPGEEEGGEGLDRELRHLETEEGVGVERKQADKFTFNLKKHLRITRIKYQDTQTMRQTVVEEVCRS